VLKYGLLWIVPGVEYRDRSEGEWVGSRRAGLGERKVSFLRPDRKEPKSMGMVNTWENYLGHTWYL
jgi:hypothetical protein